MRDLLIATTNKKKLEELQTLLAGMPVRLLTLKDFPHYQEVVETGKTFEENAVLKATGYAKQTGLLTLGEDSGLCCEALDNAPGVYSARFAGPGKSDQDNNQKLLKVLESVPDNCRRAFYKSVAALAEPDRLVGVVSGEVYGYITKEPRGSGGFGYDPLFHYPAFNATFGQVSSDQKHSVSHRSKALVKIKDILLNFLS